MRIRWWGAAAVLAGLILGQVGAAAARDAIVGDARISYSAKRTVTVDGKVYVGKVFHNPGKERNEQNVSGIDLDFILDLDGAEGFIVVPGLNSYVAHHIPPILGELNPDRLKGLAVGEDRVAGLRATKYRLDYTASDGTHGEGFIWVGEDNILLKIEGRIERPKHKPMVLAMELSDIRPGPQNPALFKPPEGMKRIPEEALQMLLNLNLKLPGRK